MSQNISINVVLVGPHAGMTILKGSTQFVNGKAEVSGPPSAVNATVSALQRYHSAFVEGSVELASAQKNWEARDGERDLQQGERKPASSEGSGNQQDGKGSAPVSPNAGAGATGGQAGSLPDNPNGSGLPNTGNDGGVNQGAEGNTNEAPGSAVTHHAPEPLVKAVLALDPEVDDQWTEDGLPALSAVETAYGQNGVTRQDVDLAVPGWNREKSLEEKVRNL